MTQGRIRRGPAVPAAPPAMDDLSVLLPDWRTHLRSRNVAPSTIASYLKVGDNLLVWLREAGMPTRAPRIAPEHPAALPAAPPHPGPPPPPAKPPPPVTTVFPGVGGGGGVGPPPKEPRAPPRRARAAGRHPHRRRAPRAARRRPRQHLREPPGHR